MKEIIRSMEESISRIDNEIIKLQCDKEKLIGSKEVLFRTNNICPDCYGEGNYYRKSDGMDPYERSSDLKEKCVRCKGTGKYFGS